MHADLPVVTVVPTRTWIGNDLSLKLATELGTNSVCS